MKYFLIIPLYNEEKHIADVLKKVSKYNLPVVVVDDGSKDNSKLKVKSLKLKNLTFLEHKINLGKGAAMKTGADYAFEKGADAVIFMDADGQHEAKDIREFVTALDSKKYDIVFGSRNFGFEVPLIRYLGNKIASVFMAVLFKIYVSDVICGFKALTKKAYEKINWESSGYGVESEMVAKTGLLKLRFYEIPVETIYHDKVKGVTILNAFGILVDVVKWRLLK